MDNETSIHKIFLFQDSIELMTTSSGQQVDIRDTNTLNTNLISNKLFLDSLLHTVSERIPERMVHAKGAGAFGYFEVINNITDICNANLFNSVGKRTPVALRFSHTIPSLGSADSVRDSRGASIKFYTEEGNLDLVCLNTPIFTFKDPGLFAQLFHSNRINPSTNLLDSSSRWDFITLKPETIFQTLWTFSDYGIPNGYRHMPYFAIHTYEIVNKKGESHYVRFNFTTNQGIENLNSEEAAILSATDPDYFIQDLYNAIANKNYPSWNLYIDVITKYEAGHANFDPFDITRLWPLGSYKTLFVGHLVLNRNPVNHFAEMEQIAFCPGNLVPGILPPPDKLFQGRVIAYRDTQNHRLGFNHNNILVNQPKYAKTYNRDGTPPIKTNMKDIPNYYPNTFDGPIPIIDSMKPQFTLTTLESNAVDMGPPSEFYKKILNKAQRRRLINNLVGSISKAVPDIQERALRLFEEVHPDLANRVATGLLNFTVTTPTPLKILYP